MPCQVVLGGSKGGLFGTLNTDYSPMVRPGVGGGGKILVDGYRSWGWGFRGVTITHVCQGFTPLM